MAERWILSCFFFYGGQKIAALEQNLEIDDLYRAEQEMEQMLDIILICGVEGRPRLERRGTGTDGRETETSGNVLRSH